MLAINTAAPCKSCTKNLKVVQKDSTEATEKWVCQAYTEGCPSDIILEANSCKYFEDIDK